MINWDVRYAGAVARLPELADSATRILEVGAGGGGLRRYVTRPIVGIELDLQLAAGARPWGVVARAGRLPFPDQSFDAVLIMDVMEHLGLDERRKAIAEMARVSRGRVLIGGPFGNFAAWGDARYAEHLRQSGRGIPGWLAEHLQLGIPSLAELLGLLNELHLDYRLYRNESLIQHYAGVLADEMGFLAQVNASFRHKRADRPPLGADSRDVPYSYLVEILGHLPRARPQPTSSPPVAGNGRLAIFHEEIAGLAPLPDHRAVAMEARGARFPWPANGPVSLLHKVWRQQSPDDFIGICAPGRFFDFRSLAANQPYREALQRGAVIIAAADKVQPNVAEHYMHDHFAGHYLAAINLVLAQDAYYHSVILEQFSSGRLFGELMFICHRSVFEELCEWLFNLLDTLAPICGFPDDSVPAGLEPLARRLLSLFFQQKFASGSEVIEVPIVSLEVRQN